ncbi:uncharacterized protein F5891DRAFT_1191161 [Suillus fuscotomentosus]|uniref:Uncharacterized protein n=1 Tax=Suillus fuscotomentosus TaxID=1912939 RepID=A0AAD4E226_9AGAM|nr:uncharacterized protein F5891DRAFT_1191161 [Suillus fuscotomentosus]KAG1898177.1 hypothetical protein F5891DRAFT_1191161 [Suillus fuscotomentosus]
MPEKLWKAFRNFGMTLVLASKPRTIQSLIFTFAQALQQCFNDQLVTLRLTKESVSKVQDRLQSTNGAILVALNATLAEYNNRASAAEECKCLLQHILDEANIATNSLHKELSD